MPQSLVKNYVYLIFSTKGREPLIYPPFEEELYSYIASICKSLECPPIKIGGYTDHVHILCLLSKKVALMKLLEDVKSDSSQWMKTKHPALEGFYWQRGYAAFSIHASDADRIAQYIDNQHSHHAETTFQEEYRLFLTSNDMEFDERYVWD